jgi:hypothetical protein
MTTGASRATIKARVKKREDTIVDFYRTISGRDHSADQIDTAG